MKSQQQDINRPSPPPAPTGINNKRFNFINKPIQSRKTGYPY